MINKFKTIVVILGLINGVYMYIDGTHVLITGKYIGSETPGPWSHIFNLLNVDISKLGLLFILYSILWHVWIHSFITKKSWNNTFGILISILTLWYLPFGTIISLIILLYLIINI